MAIVNYIDSISVVLKVVNIFIEALSISMMCDLQEHMNTILINSFVQLMSNNKLTIVVCVDRPLFTYINQSINQ